MDEHFIFPLLRGDSLLAHEGRLYCVRCFQEDKQPRQVRPTREPGLYNCPSCGKTYRVPEDGPDRR